MSTTLLITLFSLHLVALISPGPDFFIVVKNSLANGRNAGILTALWIATGLSVHIGYSILWLGYLISQSIIIFTALKVIWWCYLVWIGYQSWKSKWSSLEQQLSKTHPAKSNREAFSNGFLTNVFNPKATLYFLSVFTTLITPDIQKSSLIMLGIILMAMTALWFSVVACFFAKTTIRSWYDRGQNTINKIFWGILIVLWLKVLVTK